MSNQANRYVKPPFPKARVSPKEEREQDKFTSVTIPRTTWTFTRLPNEDEEQGLNRFIFSILSSRETLRRFTETMLQDCYVKEVADKETTADFTESVAKIVEDTDNLFQYVKR